MNNKIEVFKNEQFGEIRTALIENEPWFVAVDVCRALEIGNSSQAISRLDADEKMITLISNEGNKRGNPNMTVVNEPGLYTLMNDNRMIRIMVFEPGRAPYTTMLEDSLEHRQELVGGDIECIPLPCETVLCCNASGKLTGLPENRQYGPDILHGTFFLYGDTPEGRGVSLTDEQIAMYQEYFPQPVPAAVSFEVRSAADMKEFMNLMFGKGWDMDTGAGEDMEASR